MDGKHDYLKQRGIRKKKIKEFGLGFAMRGSMKGRICFPIHNQNGELIAYPGRWVEDDKPKNIPRYLLPKGFEKSQVLYNLNRVVAHEGTTNKVKCSGILLGSYNVAKCSDPIDVVGASKSTCFTSALRIVEGFWSVLRLHGAGIPVVSTFGGSVSDAQVDLLVQAGIDHCVLIFDGDEGGRLGTMRALPVLASRLYITTIGLEDGVKPDTMDNSFLTNLPRYVHSD